MQLTSCSVASLYNPFMHNNYVISTSNSRFFLTGGYSFQNPPITISSGLICFVSLSFSVPVPLFEAMDMVLLMDEIAFYTVETLAPLPNLQFTDLSSAANTVMREHIQSHDNFCY